MQKTQQFFTQTFFPAYEHSLKLEEERLKLREKNRSGLADPDKARYLKKKSPRFKEMFFEAHIFIIYNYFQTYRTAGG